MPRLIDLTLPIEDHFRWRFDVTRLSSFGDGQVFQSSQITIPCHAFTHVDAPVHFVPGGLELAEVPLSTWVGRAAVVDCTEVGESEPITAELLARRGRGCRPGTIALLRTRWDERASIQSAAYWEQAPYVTRDAAEWLREQGVKSVGFDFPQDRCIRDMVRGEPVTADGFVTHDVLLRHGIGLVEYLAGLGQIEADEVLFAASPLRLPDVDGSPVRAFAIEDDVDDPQAPVTRHPA